MKAPRSAGFTLLEALVALAILAVGLAAAVRAVSAGTDAGAALRDRQLADWVAADQLALLRARRARIEPGQQEGSVEMGRQRFRWRRVAASADDGRVVRVEVNVAELSGGRAGADLARRVAYLVQP